MYVNIYKLHTPLEMRYRENVGHCDWTCICCICMQLWKLYNHWRFIDNFATNWMWVICDHVYLSLWRSLHMADYFLLFEETSLLWIWRAHIFAYQYMEYIVQVSTIFFSQCSSMNSWVNNQILLICDMMISYNNNCML